MPSFVYVFISNPVPEAPRRLDPIWRRWPWRLRGFKRVWEGNALFSGICVVDYADGSSPRFKQSPDDLSHLVAFCLGQSRVRPIHVDTGRGILLILRLPAWAGRRLHIDLLGGRRAARGRRRSARGSISRIWWVFAGELGESRLRSLHCADCRN